jgi:hypothetical protein
MGLRHNTLLGDVATLGGVAQYQGIYEQCVVEATFNLPALDGVTHC